MKYGRFTLFSKRSSRSYVVDHVDGQKSKTGCSLDKKKKETGGIEIKLEKTTELDGTLIYLKVFIKIAVSNRRKPYFLGRPYDLQADLDFYVVLQRWVLHGLNVVARIYIT